MKLQNIIFCCYMFLSLSVNAQDMANYTDNWEGKIKNSKTFHLKVELHNAGTEKAIFKIYNDENSIDFPFKSTNEYQIKIPLVDNLSFEGILAKNKKEINGFIKSGLLLYHLKLTKSKKNSYTGNWNILMVDELQSLDFYLSVENGSKETYQAYPILGDNRFTGTWCDNFQKENEVISFSDFKTGLAFKGKLEPNSIQLGIYLANHILTKIDLKKIQNGLENRRFWDY